VSAGAIVGIAAAVIVLGAVLALLVGGRGFRERTTDLAAEFWDWLRLGR
jgi:ABC-type transporter Mla subunit MlaD